MLTKTANKFLSGISNAAKNYWGVVKGDLLTKNTGINTKADIMRELLKKGDPRYHKAMKNSSRRIKEVGDLLADAKAGSSKKKFIQKYERRLTKLKEMQKSIGRAKDSRAVKFKSRLKRMENEIRGNKLLTFGARGTAVAVPGVPAAYYANKKYNEFMEPNI